MPGGVPAFTISIELEAATLADGKAELLSTSFDSQDTSPREPWWRERAKHDNQAFSTAFGAFKSAADETQEVLNGRGLLQRPPGFNLRRPLPARRRRACAGAALFAARSVWMRSNTQLSLASITHHLCRNVRAHRLISMTFLLQAPVV